MSEASLAHVPCDSCEREVCALELWRCECGLVECCPACVEHVGEYHRVGECGLDAALDRALAKDDCPKDHQKKGGNR
jgi:hypothetical protein